MLATTASTGTVGCFRSSTADKTEKEDRLMDDEGEAEDDIETESRRVVGFEV